MLEVCVDTIAGANAAIAGGAGRIELCSSLSEGGLTPSAGLMRQAATLPVPCHAMIRPRSGLFHFSDAETAIMLADIETARQAGLAGVVLGAQTDDGTLDIPVLTRLIAAADGMATTLHRVIDVVPDTLDAVDQAAELGFDRILTSGTKPSAPDGIDMIARMAGRAAGRLSIMPGCGLTPENIGDFRQIEAITEFHAACSRPVPGKPAFSDFDPPGGRFETSEVDVRRMVAAITAQR